MTRLSIVDSGCMVILETKENNKMLKLVMVLTLTLLSFSSTQVSSQSMTCGLRPLPQLGCRIGRCVGGVWEQVCN